MRFGEAVLSGMSQVVLAQFVIEQIQRDTLLVDDNPLEDKDSNFCVYILISTLGQPGPRFQRVSSPLFPMRRAPAERIGL
jgi:hypothetical protein